VFFNDRLGYAATLGEAIDQALTAAESSAGGTGTTPPTTTPPTGGQPPTTTTPNANVKQLLDQAATALEDAQKALERGDLAGYQTGVNRARDLIRQAQQASGSS
jgi:uncharacterized protein